MPSATEARRPGQVSGSGPTTGNAAGPAVPPRSSASASENQARGTRNRSTMISARCAAFPPLSRKRFVSGANTANLRAASAYSSTAVPVVPRGATKPAFAITWRRSSSTNQPPSKSMRQTRSSLSSGGEQMTFCMCRSPKTTPRRCIARTASATRCQVAMAQRRYPATSDSSGAPSRSRGWRRRQAVYRCCPSMNSSIRNSWPAASW